MTDQYITAATHIALARYQTGELDDQAIEREIERYARFLTGLSQTLANDDEPNGVEPTARTPAVPIEDSITDDYLICLEDGARLKMLKRHLRVRFGLTPQEYRRKWGLPPTYPMIAPAQSRRKSAIAKLRGLGTYARKSERAA